MRTPLSLPTFSVLGVVAVVVGSLGIATVIDDTEGDAFGLALLFSASTALVGIAAGLCIARATIYLVTTLTAGNR